jgi:hypothetical protein
VVASLVRVLCFQCFVASERLGLLDSCLCLLALQLSFLFPFWEFLPLCLASGCLVWFNSDRRHAQSASASTMTSRAPTISFRRDHGPLTLQTLHFHANIGSLVSPVQGTKFCACSGGPSASLTRDTDPIRRPQQSHHAPLHSAPVGSAAPRLRGSFQPSGRGCGWWCGGCR